MDISFKITWGYFGKIWARSSLEVRCTEIGGSVIDADNRGQIVALFFNISDKEIDIKKGKKFCQIVFKKIANHPVLREVENFDEDKAVRGEGSFESTNNVCLQDFRQ